MKKALLLVVCCVFAGLLVAQEQEHPTVTVPRVVQFADMELELSPALRKTVQADVNALTISPTYFLRKLDVAQQYFPIIEREFKAAGLPEDFKYLIIQESGLKPDAVSASNAVGFWQFKDFTAVEQGLTLNSQVDERMSIGPATRAAAKYLKKHNEAFDNWLYALLAYNTGLSGSAAYTKSRYFGKKRMALDNTLHWYVKKFLAHMLAYGHYHESGRYAPSIELVEFDKGNGKTLKEIAYQFAASPETTRNYNLWLKGRQVPRQGSYTVIVPLRKPKKAVPATMVIEDIAPTDTFEVKAPPVANAVIRPQPLKNGKPGLVTMNGLRAVVAGANDDVVSLALKGTISTDKFRRYNDMGAGQAVVAGQVYYLQRKRGKAKVYYHTTLQGETLWYVAQRYGIRLSKLLAKNRFKQESNIRVGRVLWLRFTRPASTAVVYRELTPAQKKAKPPVLATNPNAKPQNKPAAQTATPVQSGSAQPKKPVNRATVLPVALPALPTLPIARLLGQATVQAWPALPQVQPPTVLDTAQVPVQEPADGWSGVGNVFEDGQQQQAATSPPVANPTAAPIGTPAAGSQTAATLTPLKHTVVAGETLYGIGRKYGVKAAQLTAWNKLNANEPLAIGQVLVVKQAQQPENSPQQNTQAPVTQDEPQNYILHTVQPGETLYRISRKYNVTIKNILDWNNKKALALKTGEQLKIYPAKTLPAND